MRVPRPPPFPGEWWRAFDGPFISVTTTTCLGVRPDRLDHLSPKWDIGDARRVPAANQKPLHWAGYVLHAFQKKSPSGIKTAKRDVDLVTQRLKAAQRDYKEHHAKTTR